jgi:hypothetical protein
MKNDDPEREAARQACDDAEFNLEILARGIGRALAEELGGDYDRVRYLIKRVNTDLLKAVEAAEAADKAYRPYCDSPLYASPSQIHNHKAPGGNYSAS